MKIADICKKIKNAKSYMFLIPGLAAGIILLLFSSSQTSSQKKNENAENETISFFEYIQIEEERLTSLISSIGGVGNVSVMIRFDSGSEYVYQSNAYKSEPILLEEYSPTVSGVAVVCSGGELPQCQKAIIDLVSALYGISTSRISVSGTK